MVFTYFYHKEHLYYEKNDFPCAFNDNMFFVNDTEDGVFPSVIDAYRI